MNNFHFDKPPSVLSAKIPNFKSRVPSIFTAGSQKGKIDVPSVLPALQRDSNLKMRKLIFAKRVKPF